jgi:hypothetical protein
MTEKCHKETVGFLATGCYDPHRAGGIPLGQVTPLFSVTARFQYPSASGSQSVSAGTKAITKRQISSTPR